MAFLHSLPFNRGATHCPDSGLSSSSLSALSARSVRPSTVKSGWSVWGDRSRCARSRLLATVLKAFLLASLGPLATSAGAAAAQVDGRVRNLEREDCRGCEIRLTPLVTLGDVEGPGAIGIPYVIDKTATGEYLVASHPVRTEVQVFGPDGVARPPIGGVGDGPGEFRFIRWIEALGDQVHIFDPQSQRWTILTSDLEVVETRRLLVPLRYALADILPTSDSTFMMNATLNSPERVGFVLHSFRPDGTVAVSMAEDPLGFQPNVPESVWMRQLANARRGGVWASFTTAFRIDRWSLDGTLIESLIDEPEWFPRHLGEYRIDPEDPLYLPVVEDLREAPDGLLWVLIRVPEADWSASIVPSGRDDGRWTIENPDDAFDTRIEVIDPEIGAVVATTTSDRMLNAFVGEDEVASFGTGAGGFPEISVFRLSLSMPDTSRRARAPEARTTLSALFHSTTRR